MKFEAKASGLSRWFVGYCIFHEGEASAIGLPTDDVDGTLASVERNDVGLFVSSGLHAAEDETFVGWMFYCSWRVTQIPERTLKPTSPSSLVAGHVPITIFKQLCNLAVFKPK